MPRLMLFAVCSRVIEDNSDGDLTLVSLLEAVAGYYPPGQSKPTEMSVGIRWSAVAVWWKLPEDEGRSFEQSVIVMSPDGEEMGGISHSFQMKLRSGRISVNGRSFPTRGEGEHMVRLSLREAKEDAKWETITEYPIFVVYQERDVADIE